MRRGLYGEKERIVIRRVEQERQLFKYKMLASPAGEIYDGCNKIWFYECVFEYFQYCSDIEEGYIKACLKEVDIIAALWAVYSQHEYLRVGTWEDVEELLRVLLRKQSDTEVIEAH